MSRDDARGRGPGAGPAAPLAARASDLGPPPSLSGKGKKKDTAKAGPSAPPRQGADRNAPARPRKRLGRVVGLVVAVLVVVVVAVIVLAALYGPVGWPPLDAVAERALSLWRSVMSLGS